MTPAMKALLDAIGAKEAPRGYDQIFGWAEANKDIGRVTLTAMTLDQIRALQTKMLNVGSPSTACGRYQFLRKTLDATRMAMGVPGSAKWTPALQDEMALHLMRGRGLDKYLAGRMSREAFANNLAMEWASLPVVTRIKGQQRMVDPGESYYAGDGLNKSFHDPGDILKLVDALKADAGKPVLPPVSPPVPPAPGPEPLPPGVPSAEGYKPSIQTVMLILAAIGAAIAAFFGFK